MQKGRINLDLISDTIFDNNLKTCLEPSSATELREIIELIKKISSNNPLFY